MISMAIMTANGDTTFSTIRASRCRAGERVRGSRGVETMMLAAAAPAARRGLPSGAKVEQGRPGAFDPTWEMEDDTLPPPGCGADVARGEVNPSAGAAGGPE
jgi:hypothetical protein